MAVTLAEAVVYFKGDDKQLAADLKKSEGDTNNAASNMAKAFGGLVVGGAIAAGTAIAGIGIQGVEAFTSFQKQMNEVFTLLPGISQKGMDDMTSQVKDFAKQFGVLPDKVVPALYQALSAGVPPDNVFKFLATAQKAASGGVTDLKVSVNGITSVVNAYGADVLDAAKASDEMFTTVRLGKTNFEELSASLFNVIPTAASLGVSFGDVSAALATMTLQGVPTSVATTQLRQLFVELSQAGGKASKTFQQIAGETFVDFIKEGHNVADALGIMEVGASESNVRLSDMFSSVEAGNAALALTGNNAKTFGDDIRAMGDSAGATDTAFKTMQTGLGASFDKIKATWATTMIDVGAKLAPLVDESLPAFQGAVNTLGGIIVNVFGYIVLEVKDLHTKWDENWGGMRTTLDIFTKEVPGQWQIFWDQFNHISDVGMEGATTDWQLNWGYSWPQAITGFITLALAEMTEFTIAINGILRAFYALFYGDWAGFWAGLYQTLNAAVDDMLNVIEYIFGPGIRDKLVGALTWAWDGMKDIWKNIADWWNSTIGSLIGTQADVGSQLNLGVVNPHNVGGLPKELNTPIFAPGQLQGGNTNTKTVNVHPGAITVNGSGQPKETAEEILRILEGLAN